MKFLVDANVLSETLKSEPREQVLSWLTAHEPDLLVSPIVLGELEYGILRLPAGRKRKRLREWFDKGARVLNLIEIDATTATVWAQLLAHLKNQGTPMPVKDSIIAASALQHDLTMVTLNVKDFRPAGLRILDPSTF